MSTRAVLAGVDRTVGARDEDGTVTRSAIASYAWVAYLGVSGILAALYLFASPVPGRTAR